MTGEQSKPVPSSEPTATFYVGYVGTGFLFISIVAAVFGWVFGWKDGVILGGLAFTYLMYAAVRHSRGRTA